MDSAKKKKVASHASFPELGQEEHMEETKDAKRSTVESRQEVDAYGNKPKIDGSSTMNNQASQSESESESQSQSQQSSTSPAGVEKEQQPRLANLPPANPNPGTGMTDNDSSSGNNNNSSNSNNNNNNNANNTDAHEAGQSVENSGGGSGGSGSSGAKVLLKPEFVHQKSQTLSTVHEEAASPAGGSVATGSNGSGKGGRGAPVNQQDSDTSAQSSSNVLSGTPREYPTEFVPLLQKVEGNYRMFAPVRASALPSFNKFGDVGEESFAILELIRKSLETVNQSMHDLVRVDVRLVNVGQLKYFDDIYEQYFQNVPVPQRNVVSVEPMEKGCSIEVEVTSLIRENIVQSGGNSGRRDLDHSSFGKASFGDPNQNPNRPPFDPTSKSLCGCLGDVLPARLAQAYGYYGEKQEQVLSGLLILTILRYLLLLLAVISISLVETSDYENLFDSTYEVVRGPTWFVVVASLIVIHSASICLYSFMWWYQGDEPDHAIESTFYAVMIFFQHVGDQIFVFCSISAFTAIATLVPFTAPNEKTRVRFIGASVMSCFMFIVYILTFKLSWHTKRVFSQLGNRFRALRDSPLKPTDAKMEGVTTPVSQGSSAYNLAHASQSNSNTRLVTPNSGLGNHHLSQQYGTPMTVSSGMRLAQGIPVRSSTPSSQGSKHHHAQTPFVAPGPIQVMQQFAQGPGPSAIGVTTPNSQGKRLIAQNLNHGQVQYFQQYDAVGTVNPNQVIYIQQQPGTPFQQEGTPSMGRIVQHPQQFFQHSPTAYSSVPQQQQLQIQPQPQPQQQQQVFQQQISTAQPEEPGTPLPLQQPHSPPHIQSVNSPTGSMSGSGSGSGSGAGSTAGSQGNAGS